MSQVFREFFTFNKSDRNGMVLLILLLIAFIAIPKIQEHLIVQKKPDFSNVQQATLVPSVKSDTKQQQVVDKSSVIYKEETKDTNTTSYNQSSFKEKAQSKQSLYKEKEPKEEKSYQSKSVDIEYSKPTSKPSKSYEAPKIPVVLKDFDPNKLTLEEALSLGFSKKVASTMMKYKSKGGKFYNKESLKKIYGMTDEFFVSLEPYIKIESQKPKYVTKEEVEERVEEKREIILKEFDPNKLDEEQALSLGLPSRVASNIAKYVSKGGKFYKKEDLKKIYSFEESDYERLEKYIKIPKQKKRKWKNY